MKAIGCKLKIVEAFRSGDVCGHSSPICWTGDEIWCGKCGYRVEVVDRRPFGDIPA